MIRLSRMFPLGSVLFPGEELPLRIFEPRFRAMLDAALADDRSFGVVLISRGFEVGGGDVRTMFGTVAVIEDCHRSDDGQAVLRARGTHRIEVVEWLADDPYPQAHVVDLPEASDAGATPDSVALGRYQDTVDAFDALVELARRKGRLGRAPEPLDRGPADLVDATWALARALPLGPHDRQKLIEADSVADRADALTALIEDLTRDLHHLDDTA